jgi:hypothetical protein
MKKLLILVAIALFGFSACDDSEESNNTNNINNTNNTNNINNTNNTNNVTCDPACEDWQVCSSGHSEAVCEAAESRCATPTDCDGENALCKVNTHECVEYPTWRKLNVIIQDPVVNGSSIMTPIDGISYAFNPENNNFVTQMGHDVDNSEIGFLWTIDEVAENHTKLELSGEFFAEAENFCMNENWCQFIGYDSVNNEYIITGPRASGIMRTDDSGDSVITSVSGTQPSNGNISYSHIFDWEHRKLYVYGFMTPAGASSTLFELDLDTGLWEEHPSILPEVYNNCLAYEPSTNILYSFGGKITNDGGDTFHETDLVSVINLNDDTVDLNTLDPGIGPRASMGCAFSGQLDRHILFGGNKALDLYNEIDNEYHNDLWIYDPATQNYTQLMPTENTGTFEDPDEYGDQAFIGNENGPNFGKNRGLMQLDSTNNRLMIMGSVPIFTHEQLYFLDLEWISLYLEQN